MKGLITFFIAIGISIAAMAQAPQAINYQAVLRDASGTVLANQGANLRFTILQGSVSGTAVYTETHAVTTSSFGAFNVGIGNGTPTLGSFAGINWANGPYFLQTELDNAGTYVTLSTTQFLSVPYALYAGNVANAAPWSGCIDTIPGTDFSITSDTLYVQNNRTTQELGILPTSNLVLSLSGLSIFVKIFVNGQLSSVASPFNAGGINAVIITGPGGGGQAILNSGDIIVTQFMFDAYPCKKIFLHTTIVP